MPSALPSMVHLYLPNVDTVFQQALAAGATLVREPQDQPHGDRSGGIRGPCGNHWWIACRLTGVQGDARAAG